MRGLTGWISGELLFGLSSGLSVLLVENVEDTSGDLMVDDNLVVSANDVDTELLNKRG